MHKIDAPGFINVDLTDFHPSNGHQSFMMIQPPRTVAPNSYVAQLQRRELVLLQLRSPQYAASVVQLLTNPTLAEQ
jgi:hypothetical protein